MLVRIYDDPLRMLTDAKLAYLEAKEGGAKCIELLVRLDPEHRRVGVSLSGLVGDDACLDYEFLASLAAFKNGAWQRVPEALRPLFEGPTNEERIRAVNRLPTTPLLIALGPPPDPNVLSYQEVTVA